MITYRDERFSIEQRRELSISDYVPWCIGVAGGWYQLTNDGTDAEDAARRFIRYSLRNPLRRTPPFLASRRYPLLLSIDGVAVRAWPQYVARGTGASTFMHPTLNRRVGTERGPVWIFEAEHRPAAAHGVMTAEQTLDDVVGLATEWLRSEESRSGS